MGHNRPMSFPRQQARTQRFTIGVPRNFQVSPRGRRVTFPARPARHGQGHVSVAIPARHRGADAPGRPHRARCRRREPSSGGARPPGADARARWRHRVVHGGRRLHPRGLHPVRPGVLRGLVGDDSDPARASRGPPPPWTPGSAPRANRVAYVHKGAVRVIDIVDNGDEDRDRLLVEPDGENVTWGLADPRLRGGDEPDAGLLVVARRRVPAVSRVDESDVNRWFVGDPNRPDQESQAAALTRPPAPPTRTFAWP